MKRSGNSSWKRSISVWRVRSPERQRTSSRTRASSTSARPYGLSTVGYGGRLRKARLQFGNGGLDQLARDLGEVPVGARRQPSQPVARRSPSDDDARPGLGDGIPKRTIERGHVVTVDVVGSPAKTLPLRRDRLEGGDGGDRPVDLGVIGVEQHDEVGKAAMRREHRRLPHLTLLEFPVA